MAEVPSMTLTDPNNHQQRPAPVLSPPQSPTTHRQIEQAKFLLGGDGDKNAGTSTNSNSNVPTSPPTPPQQHSGNHANTTTTTTASTTTASSITQVNANGGSKQDALASASIDPLSQHILRRTNPLSVRPRTAAVDAVKPITSINPEHRRPLSRDQSPATSTTQEPLSRTRSAESPPAAARTDLRKGVKAVAFLSRLMGGGAKKKEDDDDRLEEDDPNGEERPEGNNAELFKQKVESDSASGLHPPPPPAYIKVRAKGKKERDFDRLFLAQELNGSKSRKNVNALGRTQSSNKLRRKSSSGPQDGEPVWALQFSRDGKYLAAAGADTVVRVWQVLGSSDDRQRHEEQEARVSEDRGQEAHSEHLLAPVFAREPVREYQGHTGTVLDLSWSKNNFLLSSSMDKTVRLWHMSRKECLCTFKHNDFVPTISFHPKDDRFFLAGSLDSKLRLWSIPDKSVAFAAQVPGDMVTAVAFTPDGKTAMAGCLSGLCMFYETEGLKYQTQIHVRSTRGQNSKGAKITGIQAMYGAHGAGDVKVVITSNDSRIRLYNLRDKSLEIKLKGNENSYSQIRARVSDCGKFVVCGSEDRRAYLWSLPGFDAAASQQDKEKDSAVAVGKRDRAALETFGACDTICTSVAIAPIKTRLALGKSEDPIYDMCNPPPSVPLKQELEKGVEANSQGSTPPNGSVLGTPAEAYESRRETPPGYSARSQHKTGHIIVTADFTGAIKVFRQDCAWQKRVAKENGSATNDNWDRGSIFGVKRSSTRASIATKRSERSLREAVGRTSTSFGSTPSEHILNWRQSIAGGSSTSERQRRFGRRGSSKAGSSRSRSRGRQKEARTYPPTKKTLDEIAPTAASVQPNPAIASAPLTQSPSPMDRAPVPSSSEKSPTSVDPLSPHHNPLDIQGGRSYVFWDPTIWRNTADRMHRMAEAHEQEPPSPNASISPHPAHHERESVAGAMDEEGHLTVNTTRNPLRNVPSYVSRLSDDVSGSDGEGEFEEAQERFELAPAVTVEAQQHHQQQQQQHEEVRCLQCKGTTFAARKGKDGKMRLACGNCGARV